MGTLVEFDRAAFEWILLYLNGENFVAVCEFIVNEDNYIVPAIIAYLLYLYKRPRSAAYLLLLLLITLGISESIVATLKEFIGRLRPAVGWGLFWHLEAYSFPSAHAGNSMAIAAFLAGWFPRAQLPWVSLSLLIGTARTISNHHYPGDILGGWLIGLLVAVFILTALSELKRWLPTYLAEPLLPSVDQH